MEKAKRIISINENGNVVITTTATFLEVVKVYEELSLIFNKITIKPKK